MLGIGKEVPKEAEKLDECKWPNKPYSLPNCDQLNQIILKP